MSCQEKRLYITEHEAIIGLIKVQRKHKVRQRVYKCDVCKGWHLTSRIFPWQRIIK